MTNVSQNAPLQRQNYASSVSTSDQLDMMLGTRGIVVIAPHPDDEILGCGALICATAAQGRPVWVIYLTDGGASQPDLSPQARKDLVLQRQSEAFAGLEELGVPSSSALFVGAPDGHLHNSKAHTKLAIFKLHELIQQGSVSAVFVTSPHDAHTDHQAAYKLAVTALRTYPGIQLYTYPISSRIDHNAAALERSIHGISFKTDRFAKQKRAALACHASQLVTDIPRRGFTLPSATFEFMCAEPEYFEPMDLIYDN